MIKTEELALDTFREMGNIGTGSALTALSNIIEKPVDEKYPEVLWLGYEQLIQSRGEDDEPVLGMLFPVTGEISGFLLFVWNRELVLEVLQSLGSTCVSLNDLDEEKISIMKELSNIMASAYFTAISSYIDIRIEIHEPAVSVDMIGAVIADSASRTVRYGNGILCIESGYAGQDAEEVSHMCFMMYQESTIAFLHALGVEI